MVRIKVKILGRAGLLCSLIVLPTAGFGHGGHDAQKAPAAMEGMDHGKMDHGKMGESSPAAH